MGGITKKSLFSFMKNVAMPQYKAEEEEEEDPSTTPDDVPLKE
jgi:hypothetical protein